MNLNSRLTLSSILITVLPRDSLLFNEKLTVIITLIILIFQLPGFLKLDGFELRFGR